MLMRFLLHNGQIKRFLRNNTAWGEYLFTCYKYIAMIAAEYTSVFIRLSTARVYPMIVCVFQHAIVLFLYAADKISNFSILR